MGCDRRTADSAATGEIHGAAASRKKRRRRPRGKEKSDARCVALSRRARWPGTESNRQRADFQSAICRANEVRIVFVSCFEFNVSERICSDETLEERLRTFEFGAISGRLLGIPRARATRDGEPVGVPATKSVGGSSELPIAAEAARANSARPSDACGSGSLGS